MRSPLRTAAAILCSIAIFIGVPALAEYAARKRFGPPAPQSELILDRWAASRTNPNYRGKAVQVNAEGFRRDRSVSLDKSPDEVRIFLLGGSTAYGDDTLYPEIDAHWRISNQQTIDFYLEQRLNSSFPKKRWQVINAGVKGYLLNQDLALFLSAARRYKPDYLVLLDGMNDLFVILRTPSPYDGYRDAGFHEEFNALTRPGDLSLPAMASVWLLNNSALYRFIHDDARERRRVSARKEKVEKSDAKPGLAGLTADEQRQYQAAAGQFDDYVHTARQIHRLAGMDGIETLFVLQPQMAVTKKRLTSIEQQLFDYWRKIDSPLYLYGFQSLYPELSKKMSAGAAEEGYRFLDLSGVFDRMEEQTFSDYCHLTPVGNRAIADAVFDSLEASFQARSVAAQ